MKRNDKDSEIEAMEVIYNTLKSVTETDAQVRVLKYVCERLGLELSIKKTDYPV